MSELILSSYTYDQGRVAINDSFSATATFNDVVSNGVLTAATYYSGNTPLESVILTIASTTGGTSGNLWSASTGSASIIANNGTGNVANASGAISLGNASTASGNLSFALGNTTTAQGGQSFAGGLLSTASGTRSFAFGQSTVASSTNAFAIGSTNTASSSQAFVGGISSFSTAENSFAFGISVSSQTASTFAIGQYTRANGTSAIASGVYTQAGGSASFAGGYGDNSTNTVKANGIASFNFSTINASYTGNGVDSNSPGAIIIGGFNQEIDSSSYGFIVGGTNGFVEGGTNAGILGGSNNKIVSGASGSFNSAIIGGSGNTVYNLEGAVIIGSSGLTASSETYKVYMQKAYIDGYIDLNPQTVMPSPQAGRMFYSGAPLNRMIVFTGATASDYMVLN